MSVDDQATDATRRTLDALRPALEAGFKGLADALARELADEHAATLEEALAEARRVADEELADLERRLVAEREQAEAEARAEHFEVEKEHRAELAAVLDQARREGRASAATEARRLLDGVRMLDGATTLGDALQRLAECARCDAERVAVLVMKQQRLQGWCFHGFDRSAAGATVSLDPKDGGLLGRVCQTAAPATGDDARLALPAFASVGAGAGRHAVALPVLVGETVVAVLYADAPRATGDLAWPAALEVLTRHASRMIETIMVAQASGVEIPRQAEARRQGA